MQGGGKMIHHQRPLLLLIGLLAVAVGLLAWINMRRIPPAADTPVLVLKAGGGEIRNATLEEIREMDAERFEATLRTTSAPPETYTYTGVPLSRIISLVMGEGAFAEADQIVVRAADGYTLAFSVADVLAAENLYVVFERDGKPLRGRESGGPGPMQLVVRRDGFGQRWCKYLTEVEIQ